MTKKDFEQTAEYLGQLGAGIEDELKEYSDAAGYCLIVFEFNKPTMAHYVSNAKRGDMIPALRAMADNLAQDRSHVDTIGPCIGSA